MRQIFILATAILALSSCKKDNDIKAKTPEQIMMESLAGSKWAESGKADYNIKTKKYSDEGASSKHEFQFGNVVGMVTVKDADEEESFVMKTDTLYTNKGIYKISKRGEQLQMLNIGSAAFGLYLEDHDFGFRTARFLDRK